MAGYSGRTPTAVKAAVDQAAPEKLWVPGSKRALERYRAEYEKGMDILGKGWPSVCAAMVQSAMEGNPFAAKFCRDTLGFTLPREVAVKQESNHTFEVVFRRVEAPVSLLPPETVEGEVTELPPADAAG